MRYVVDTNVWVGMFDLNRGDHALAVSALQKLRRDKHELFVLPQIIAEFWNVLTRPESSRGGFGLSVEQTELRVRFVERTAHVLPEPEQTYSCWRELLAKHAVTGVAVHDARIAAAMQASRLTHILTFNVDDFRRYDQIRAVHPGGL